MKIFDYAKVKDPQYFCDGRMEAHSDHVYYKSAAEADAGCSSYTESLNGLWKFHYAKNYHSIVQGFELEEYCPVCSIRSSLCLSLSYLPAFL